MNDIKTPADLTAEARQRAVTYSESRDERWKPMALQSQNVIDELRQMLKEAESQNFRAYVALRLIAVGVTGEEAKRISKEALEG